MATGMTLSLCYLTLKQMKPDAKYVIFPRIDQKTCLKSIITAGLIPIIIEPTVKEDLLTTNIDKIIEILAEFKQKDSIKEILCIASTTSCFAPRSMDSIQEISVLCKDFSISHIINNAYGIYCTKITEEIKQSFKQGEVTCVVSSTDKNLLVPVGGAFIYSDKNSFIDKVCANYAGRASVSPIVDVFITLLEMGKLEYKLMMKERVSLFNKTLLGMKAIAEGFGERILATEKGNRISMAMTLGNSICKGLEEKEVTFLGSMFFNRQISGIKVNIKTEKIKEIQGYKFRNYGSHSDLDCNLPLVVFAVAIGISEKEIEEFKVKFVKVIKEFIKEKEKKGKKVRTEEKSSNKDKDNINSNNEQKESKSKKEEVFENTEENK
eukprot:CAMPEP_0170528808 /NCGR_PEP_ID=MMETSP0209-20121228/14259_1 /TAXON_ID=665100 ORGANISM="Litonotus pictus, Strain P1" /NCGR_SAMPLE_ID=MMETSP0209 /ASSEMBLY_ACC=CAM_ASM_000301 /LENGTH=378 /DNA_ID=CAMNT_0010820211 /DNA_START=615 /DNA_END=1751 /DNA_ORIENTATION=+